MSSRLPLVLDANGQIQNLQAADDLEIPLEQRVALLEAVVRQLIETLTENGIFVPENMMP